MTAVQVVVVTARHIANGIRADARLCPVALALQEQLGPGEHEVLVGPDEVTVRADGPGRGELRAELPAAARAFIERFDTDQRVAPVTFALCWQGPGGGGQRRCAAVYVDGGWLAGCDQPPGHPAPHEGLAARWPAGAGRERRCWT